MIPAYFIALPAFPLNQNGKIDRTRLPAPTEEHLVKTEYAPPETATERKIARIWQAVLNVKQVSRHDNFFDLGGHSLKAISVLARANQTFDLDLRLRLIFEYPELKELAGRARKGGRQKGQDRGHQDPPGPEEGVLPPVPRPKAAVGTLQAGTGIAVLQYKYQLGN